MKHKIIKFYDRIILILIGMFPIFSGCDNSIRCEYGTPNADYIFKGKVVNELTGQPVKHIQISLERSNKNMYGVLTDTLYTDSRGNYSLEYNDFTFSDLKVKYKLEDIDGSENGAYYTKEDSLVLDKSYWDGSKADGWYNGKATINKNFSIVSSDIALMYGVMSAEKKDK